jgi:hypothetical protein
MQSGPEVEQERFLHRRHDGRPRVSERQAVKERQAHWRRKRGIDRIDQCLEGIGDAAEPTRVIKPGDARLRPHRIKSRKRSAEQSDTDSNAVEHDTAGKKKGKIRVWRG